jgi:hypothetical protein
MDSQGDGWHQLFVVHEGKDGCDQLLVMHEGMYGC